MLNAVQEEQGQKQNSKGLTGQMLEATVSKHGKRVCGFMGLGSVIKDGVSEKKTPRPKVEQL